MSALGRRSVSYRTMATVGLVLSIIALVIGFVITSLVIFATAFQRSSCPFFEVVCYNRAKDLK